MIGRASWLWPLVGLGVLGCDGGLLGEESQPAAASAIPAGAVGAVGADYQPGAGGHPALRGRPYPPPPPPLTEPPTPPEPEPEPEPEPGTSAAPGPSSAPTPPEPPLKPSSRNPEGTPL